MDEIFKALAHPARRRILDRLLEAPGLTLGQLVADLPMRRQSATKHLKVLEAAGLVVAQVRGREKLHYLDPLPIAGIGRRWIDKFSAAKAEAILDLKQALEER